LLNRSRCVASLVVAALPSLAQAQTRPLSLDDLYGEKRLDWSGSPPSGLTWLDDDHYVWPRTDSKTHATDWLKVDAASGRSEPLVGTAAFEAALAKLPGVSGEEARRLSHERGLVWDAKRRTLLLAIAGDLYLYASGAASLVRLTNAEGEEELPSPSPDGRFVAFVRGNNLFVVDVETQRERALTSDGAGDVLNGKLDWVYEEEVYGRGQRRAFWWSPDSQSLAWLHLDDRKVPKYTLIDDMPYRPSLEIWPYPKAGDPNPLATLFVAPAAGGDGRAIDLGKYAGSETLIVDVDWTPDGRELAFQVQNREQTWLELNLASAAAGGARTLLRETSPAWVERLGPPRWLKDGGFLWLSERSGFKHLYHYKPDGTLLRPVTSGPWEARTLHGVDEKHGYAYFSGTERSPIGLDVYRVKLDGSGLERVSSAPGTHTALFNPSLTRYLDTWSDLATPEQVRLHKADGGEARVVDANRVGALADYRLAKPELVHVTTRDGFVMEAMLLKPPDFDPARRYPVLQQTYGGPHAPQVKNAWGGVGHVFLQLLAQRGIVVWVCDNRSASGKGAGSAWPAWKRLGELELQDIEDGVAWLKQQPWVDAGRIGISGWSYGGYMTSYALTHSASFAMGVAGAPVTDWRNYDSIYTERYMALPAANPDGYKRSSPRFAAKDLHGQLLLLHGTIDDNVHPQNTLQLAQELQRAGKPFRMMLYPRSRHGIADPALVRHLRGVMLDFMLETLRPQAQATAGAAPAAGRQVR
jgi:dipeptidyl-peptidase-4